LLIITIECLIHILQKAANMFSGVFSTRALVDHLVDGLRVAHVFKPQRFVAVGFLAGESSCKVVSYMRSGDLSSCLLGGYSKYVGSLHVC